MHTNTASNIQSQAQIATTFSKLPNWLQKRTEISYLAKNIYARLGQCANASRQGLAYPSRAFLAKEIGCSIRTLSRGLRELKQHNLIVVVERGCNMPTVYKLTEHIWMLQAKTYLKPAVNMDGPHMSRPHYIYKQIIKNKQKGFRKKDIDKEIIPELEAYFKKFMEVHLRPVNEIESRKAFYAACEHINPQKIVDKAKAHASSQVTENEKKFCKGSLRWLQEECYKQDYGRHEMDYFVNYAKSFKNQTNQIPGEEVIPKPTQEEKDKVSELLRGAGFRQKMAGIEVYKDKKELAA